MMQQPFGVGVVIDPPPMDAASLVRRYSRRMITPMLLRDAREDLAWLERRDAQEAQQTPEREDAKRVLRQVLDEIKERTGME